MSGKKSFFQFTITDLEELLLENGFKKFNAKQLFSWVYQSKKKNPEDWTNISKKLKEFLLKTSFLICLKSFGKDILKMGRESFW